jgi:prepilin-type N-terminal cleavage/methylation domain-containing protein
MSGECARRTARESKRRSRADAGFTLIELLVALVLMSTIAVLLANAMRGARNGLDDLNRRRGDADIEVVQTHLRSVVAEVRPLRLPDPVADAALIEGAADRLRVISGFSPPGQHSGLYQVDLELIPGARPGRFTLIESRTLYRPPPQPGMPPPVKPRTVSQLAGDVAGMSLKYYGKSSSDGRELPAQWWDNWPDPGRLPELIAIDLLFPSDQRHYWAPLIVAVLSKR